MNAVLPFLVLLVAACFASPAPPSSLHLPTLAEGFETRIGGSCPCPASAAFGGVPTFVVVQLLKLSVKLSVFFVNIICVHTLRTGLDEVSTLHHSLFRVECKCCAKVVFPPDNGQPTSMMTDFS